MAQNYSRCTPVVNTVGPCGGSSVVPCGIYDSKAGATSKPPYQTDLPYSRTVGGRLPGLVMYVPSGSFSGFSSCFGYPIPNINIDPNETSRLINQLGNKVRTHSFDPGVSLGELNENVGMLGNAAKKLAASKFFSKLPVPHKAWLEAVYGWAPLFNDMKNAGEFLAAALSKPRRTTYRTSVVTHGTMQSASPINWDAGGTVRRVSYVVAHVVEDDRNLAYTGILDPMATAWELTPYSFVADWLIPISGWLHARAFLASLKASGCSGVITRTRGFCTNLHAGPNWRMIASPRVNEVTFTRSVGLPSLPPPRFKPLNTVLPNWRHWVDGAALLANAFSGVKLK